MKRFGEFKIVSNAPLAPGVRDLSVLCPDVAPSARAGQFAQLCTGRGEHVLPRPISVCEATSDTLRFVFRVVGGGTAALAEKRPGDTIKMIAPLGNGFPLDIDAPRVAVVGGGIGAPPLLALTKALRAQNPDRPVHAFLGFTGEPFLTQDFEQAGAALHLSTDDGHAGFHGLVTEHIAQSGLAFDALYACGPRGMLAAVAKLAEATNAQLYVSLEERMACGVGACVGCVVKVKAGGGFTYEKVCADGPVFDARRIAWEGV